MNLYEVLIYWSTLSAAVGGGIAIYPLASRLALAAQEQLAKYQEARVERVSKILDEFYVDVRPGWLNLAYGLGPMLVGLLGFLLTRNMVVALGGAVVGLLVPDAWVRTTTSLRRRKFQSQLVDVLFVLSSGLRAGLSLPQALEQVEAEMPPPASQEFGMMIKAHRLGRSLEAALQDLNDRMVCEEMNLITTAVLVARETGGDITHVITQLVGSIREKKKLLDKVHTLTLQGKMQAYIMSLLPVVFAIFARMANPAYFNLLFHDPLGNTMLMVAIGLWLVGMVLLFRLGRLEV